MADHECPTRSTVPHWTPLDQSQFSSTKKKKLIKKKKKVLEREWNSSKEENIARGERKSHRRLQQTKAKSSFFFFFFLQHHQLSRENIPIQLYKDCSCLIFPRHPISCFSFVVDSEENFSDHQPRICLPI